jgi:hypothetical protein
MTHFSIPLLRRGNASYPAPGASEVRLAAAAIRSARNEMTATSPPLHIPTDVGLQHAPLMSTGGHIDGQALVVLTFLWECGPVVFVVVAVGHIRANVVSVVSCVCGRGPEVRGPRGRRAGETHGRRPPVTAPLSP